MIDKKKIKNNSSAIIPFLEKMNMF